MAFLTHRGVNALAESIIGLFKTEVIQRKGPWRHLEAVEFATLTWVDWFNTRRLLEPIGYVPPTSHSPKFARYRGRSRRLAMARSWRFRTSVACITTTCVARRSTNRAQLF